MTERTIKEILHPDNDWEVAYPLVAQRIRALLDAAGDKTFSTAELAEALWPEAEYAPHRWRLFKAIRALVDHDASFTTYFTRGKSKRIFGKMRQSFTWHAPKYDL